MELVIKNFSELTTKELYEILKVRVAVFVVEQNCVYQDLDDIDYRSIHVFYREEDEIAAYLRIFEKDKEKGIFQIGRVLTVKRGIGLGEKIMRETIAVAKKQIDAKQIKLEAQVYAIGFYEKVGFEVCSGEFLEDGIPHVEMKRTL